MDDTLKKIQEIVANQLGLESDQVKAESHLESDLDADSLDVVEIIMEIESVFGISIDDEEAEKIRTVQEAVDLVNRLKGGE